MSVTIWISIYFFWIKHWMHIHCFELSLTCSKRHRPTAQGLLISTHPCSYHSLGLLQEFPESPPLTSPVTMPPELASSSRPAPRHATAWPHHLPSLPSCGLLSLLLSWPMKCQPPGHPQAPSFLSAPKYHLSCKWTSIAWLLRNFSWLPPTAQSEGAPFPSFYSCFPSM